MDAIRTQIEALVQKLGIRWDDAGELRYLMGHRLGSEQYARHTRESLMLACIDKSLAFGRIPYENPGFISLLTSIVCWDFVLGYSNAEDMWNAYHAQTDNQDAPRFETGWHE